MTTLRINEIFHSIQGESTWAGLPCVFVRLTGCHLRCAYCDTEYAFHQGERMTIEAVLQQVQSIATTCDLVEVTGGEPLLQPGVHELMQQLCDIGKTVLLETSGACDISPCDPRVIRIMDLKTPGSGECERNLWSNLDHLLPHDEIKFVLCSREDYLWAREVIQKHRLTERVHAVLLGAVTPMAPGLEIKGVAGMSPRDLALWMLEDQRNGLFPGGGPGAGRGAGGIRWQTQLHKIIWDPQTRGV